MKWECPGCGRVSGHTADCPKAEGLSTHEPMPVVNDRTAIQDLVIADIAERKRVGIERYGTPLQAFNGRNALVDAYQEALDLVMYLRQMIEEQAAG